MLLNSFWIYWILSIYYDELFKKKFILISAFTKELMHSFENLLNNLLKNFCQVLKVNTIQPEITTLIIP
jgi:hypothetical protein